MRIEPPRSLPWARLLREPGNEGFGELNVTLSERLKALVALAFWAALPEVPPNIINYAYGDRTPVYRPAVYRLWKPIPWEFLKMVWCWASTHLRRSGRNSQWRKINRIK